MAASEKLTEEFCETIHKEPSSKAWSMWQHHIPPKKFILKALSPLPCWQQHSLLLTVLESIHKFIIELHVLQYLFVRESNKKQRTGRIFFISYDNQVLLGFAMWLPSLHPSGWPRRVYNWTRN